MNPQEDDQAVIEKPEDQTQVVADQTADTPAAETAAEPEAVEPEEKPHGNTGKRPWYMERLSAEASRRADSERRAEAAEREAREAKALLQRLQQGKEGETPQAPYQQHGNEDFETAVNRAATQRHMNEVRNDIIQRGYQEFGAAKFDNAANILAALDLTNDDFIGDVVSVDRANAHKLLATIAADPEKASALASMSSRQRVAELVRMNMAQNPIAAETAKPAPAAKISKAPAPPPPVQTSASRNVDWRSDEASDEEFDRGWKEMMKTRNARR